MVRHVGAVTAVLFFIRCVHSYSLSTPRSFSSSQYLAWFDEGRYHGSPVQLSHRVDIDPLDHPDPPSRLVRYAPLVFPHHLPTKNRVVKALKYGKLLLNGMPYVEGCRYVKSDDMLTLFTDGMPQIPTDDEITKRMNFVQHVSENGGLRAVYEDNHLAVVFKSAGVHTKSNTNHRYLSLEDALPVILSPPEAEGALALPLAVHRLDVRVSGLVIVAKTKKAMVGLGDLFSNRSIKKTYQALVVGNVRESLCDLVGGPVVQDSGVEGQYVISSPIHVVGRGCLPARTFITILDSVPHEHWGELCLVELQPQTGRTHQLRIHCADVGCPIVGDDLYWDRARDARTSIGVFRTREITLPQVQRQRGLFLQSQAVEFMHPVTSDVMKFKVPLPEKFLKLMAKAKEAAIYNAEGRC